MTPIGHIRDAKPSERDALGELHKRSSYIWEEDRASLEAHPDALGVDEEAIEDGRVRVALGRDGELIGFCTVAEGEGGACELEDLFVEPLVMHQGVGRTLVEDAVERAIADGRTHMTVIAAARTVPFYERLGFVAGETASTRFGPAVRLRRELG